MSWIYDDDPACERANQLYSRLTQRWYAHFWLPKENKDYLGSLANRAYAILQQRIHAYLIRQRSH